MGRELIIIQRQGWGGQTKYILFISFKILPLLTVIVSHDGIVSGYCEIMVHWAVTRSDPV